MTKKTSSPSRWFSRTQLFVFAGLCLSSILLQVNCTPPIDPQEELSGGATTVFETTRNAYSRAARNMPKKHLPDFFVGSSFFNSSWVIAPASTGKRDGLGPLYNARSCSACHFKDGRGKPPEKEGEALLSLLIRLSIPGKGPHGGPNPEPTYGGQLNGRAVPNIIPEGDMRITYKEIKGTFADGTEYSLRKPTYTFVNLGFGPMHKDVMFSPRVAPSVFGLGLLEAIPESRILQAADPDDKDKDGISGRANRVWSVKAKKTVLGRFGWKANEPNLEQQNAGAFLGDIGITSPLFPKTSCTSKQTKCINTPHGGAPELPQLKVDQVTLYTRYLAVPARRGWDAPEVQRGKRLFLDAGCGKCHTPKHQTGEAKGFPALSHQTIYPYTDLLVHDMGKELADGRPDFLANGNEWRTPPLWGIGLQKTVNRHTYFLHDGRARNLQEAILWHGGEGESAKEAFRKMNRADRDAVIRFLNSL